MFSKASKTTQTTSKNGSNSTAEKKGGLSVINADLRVTGDLISESDVQVDGSVNGDILKSRKINDLTNHQTFCLTFIATILSFFDNVFR
jgi:cytoskeletal protein CcmA (bactofilin family)